MNLSDLNPISGLVSSVGNILTKYIPSEADRQKAMAEVQAEGNRHEEALAALDVEDVKSARANTSTMTHVFACAVTLGFFGLLGYVLYTGKIPEGNAGTILTGLIGSLGTVWIQVAHFYVGSSHGSQNKDATISNLAKGS